jgi:flagellar protein FlgJ
LRERTGLPPSLVVAMAINETGWGQSVLARQAANYFGIKALTGSGTAGVLSVDTWEVLDGKTVQVQAPFRAYRTFEDGLLDLGAFLRKNPRYGMVWQAGSDPVAVARAMHKAGYATDPAWPDKLTRIIERYGLRTLDVA